MESRKRNARMVFIRKGLKCFSCSADSLEDAPTEAGFHLDGHIDKVLSELQDEGERQQLRRYSRSFSEPNLALHFLQAVRATVVRPLIALCACSVETSINQTLALRLLPC